MPRRNRIEYVGALYHVMDRGNRKERIFINDRDRKTFIKTLGEVCERTGWRIHAYILMENHYHLLVETPEPNLVKGMHWLQATYTIRFNTGHQVCGHLFQGRYKAIPVDGEEKSYFQTASDYIHLNPMRAKILKLGETLEEYSWSSFPLLIGSPKLRPTWLAADRTLYQGDTARDREAYRKQILSRVVAERDDEEAEDKLLVAERKEMRRGWYIGSPDFRDHLDEIMEKEDRKPSTREYGETEAERLLILAMRHFKLTKANLKEMRKGQEEKVVIAAFIKSRTTVTSKWLAENLNMGKPSYLRYLCTHCDIEKVENLSRKIKH